MYSVGATSITIDPFGVIFGLSDANYYQDLTNKVKSLLPPMEKVTSWELNEKAVVILLRNGEVWEVQLKKRSLIDELEEAALGKSPCCFCDSYDYEGLICECEHLPALPKDSPLTQKPITNLNDPAFEITPKIAYGMLFNKVRSFIPSVKEILCWEDGDDKVIITLTNNKKVTITATGINQKVLRSIIRNKDR